MSLYENFLDMMSQRTDPALIEQIRNQYHSLKAQVEASTGTKEWDTGSLAVQSNRVTALLKQAVDNIAVYKSATAGKEGWDKVWDFKHDVYNIDNMNLVDSINAAAEHNEIGTMYCLLKVLKKVATDIAPSDKYSTLLANRITQTINSICDPTKMTAAINKSIAIARGIYLTKTITRAESDKYNVHLETNSDDGSQKYVAVPAESVPGKAGVVKRQKGESFIGNTNKSAAGDDAAENISQADTNIGKAFAYYKKKGIPALFVFNSSGNFNSINKAATNLGKKYESDGDIPLSIQYTEKDVVKKASECEKVLYQQDYIRADLEKNGITLTSDEEKTWRILTFVKSNETGNYHIDEIDGAKWLKELEDYIDPKSSTQSDKKTQIKADFVQSTPKLDEMADLSDVEPDDSQIEMHDAMNSDQITDHMIGGTTYNNMNFYSKVENNISISSDIGFACKLKDDVKPSDILNLVTSLVSNVIDTVKSPNESHLVGEKYIDQMTQVVNEKNWVPCVNKVKKVIGIKFRCDDNTTSAAKPGALAFAALMLRTAVTGWVNEHRDDLDGNGIYTTLTDKLYRKERRRKSDKSALARAYRMYTLSPEQLGDEDTQTLKDYKKVLSSITSDKITTISRDELLGALKSKKSLIDATANEENSKTKNFFDTYYAGILDMLKPILTFVTNTLENGDVANVNDLYREINTALAQGNEMYDMVTTEAKRRMRGRNGVPFTKTIDLIYSIITSTISKAFNRSSGTLTFSVDDLLDYLTENASKINAAGIRDGKDKEYFTEISAELSNIVANAINSMATYCGKSSSGTSFGVHLTSANATDIKEDMVEYFNPSNENGFASVVKNAMTKDGIYPVTVCDTIIGLVYKYITNAVDNASNPEVQSQLDNWVNRFAASKANLERAAGLHLGRDYGSYVKPIETGDADDLDELGEIGTDTTTDDIALDKDDDSVGKKPNKKSAKPTDKSAPVDDIVDGLDDLDLSGDPKTEKKSVFAVSKKPTVNDFDIDGLDLSL